MRIGGTLIVTAALCASLGCSEQEPSVPLGLEPEYTEWQLAADDPRARVRGALEKIGQGDKVPEDASLEELQTLLDEKVEKGLIPKEHAQKLLKVLESADAHNQRLERMDEQLFGENSF